MTGMEHYGPYAFGVVMLIIVWKAIVNPMLSVATTLAVGAEAMKEATRTIKNTAETLDVVSNRLEKLESHHEQLNSVRNCTATRHARPAAAPADGKVDART